MKKLLVLSSVAALSFAAQAEIKAPTVYGRINKIVQNVTQDDNRAEGFSGIQDMGGAPTQLGAKGSFPINSLFTAKYVVEMGVNSEKTTNDITTRQLNITLASKFGDFQFGQAYVASGAIGKFDPLKNTVAYLGGSNLFKNIDRNFDKKTTVEGVGYSYNLRQELYGYKSPKFMGAQVHATTYRTPDDQSVQSSSTSFATVYDVALNYKKQMGEMGLRAHLGYVADHGTVATYSNGTKYAAAVAVAMKGAEVSLGYSAYEQDKNDKEEFSQLFLGAKYVYNKHTAAVTYAMREDSDVDGDMAEATQASVGYIYNFNKNFETSLTYTMLDLDDKDPAAVAADDNKPTSLGLAASLRF